MNITLKRFTDSDYSFGIFKLVTVCFFVYVNFTYRLSNTWNIEDTTRTIIAKANSAAPTNIPAGSDSKKLL